MKRISQIKEDFQAQWDKRTGKEILMPGARVKVAHKGRMVIGKVIRYDKASTPLASVPFYVVDVGEYESKIVPAKDTEPLREAVDDKTRRFSDAEAYCENRAKHDVFEIRRHVAEVYKITGTELNLMVRKAYDEACE